MGTMKRSFNLKCVGEGGVKWLLNLVSDLLSWDDADTHPPSELTVALPTKKRNKFGCSSLNSYRCSRADANAFSFCGCCGWLGCFFIV